MVHPPTACAPALRDRAIACVAAVLLVPAVWGCAPSIPTASTGPPTGYDRLEESVASPDAFEQAPDSFDPASVVPASLLAGPHHRVRGVRLDHRFLHTYEIESDLGDLEVVGRGMLRERVFELEALGAIQTSWLGGTRLYALEVLNAVGEPIEDTLQILRHPVRTAINVPKGVVASFRALREMKDMGRTYAEDDYYEELIGLSGQKREWAERMGLDPYSTNPYVQARLTRNGWLSWAGGTTVRLAMLPIPTGAATITMSVVSAASGMNEQLADVAPEDIRFVTRRFLTSELEGDSELATRFREHPWYSPTAQHTIIRALSRMQDAAHRDRFIEMAARADEPHEAYAFTRLALMFAESNDRRAPVVEIFVVDDLLMARNTNGELVLPLYMDHGYWTAELAAGEAEVVTSLGPQYAEAPRLLLVSGVFSPRAVDELEQRGWEVIQELEDLWLGEHDRLRYQPRAPGIDRIIPELGH